MKTSRLQTRILLVRFFLVSFFVLISSLHVSASQTDGDINSVYYSARVCHSVSCSSYGSINFIPAGATSPIVITDTAITGYAWGSELGWINMNPSGAGVTVDPVTGLLYGTAWAQTGGWVNFRPSNSGPLLGDIPIGVSINDDGEFYGYAWAGGAYGGWIRFDCTSLVTCVKTDYRRIGLRRLSAAVVAHDVVQLEASTSTDSLFEEAPSVYIPIPGAPNDQSSEVSKVSTTFPKRIVQSIRSMFSRTTAPTKESINIRKESPYPTSVAKVSGFEGLSNIPEIPKEETSFIAVIKMKTVKTIGVIARSFSSLFNGIMRMFTD